jgi:2-amino-4-hydroxy-6-hydroxymethyldihydropteridine diphosphokinase
MMGSSNGDPSFVILGLGSNRGEGRVIFEGAQKRLSERLRDLRRSDLYVSDPLYVTDQPAFLNAAVAGYFSGTPYELLEFIQGVEGAFGRDRSLERRRGERTLDIDILLFGDLVISDPPRLELPHPNLLERKFALLPLLDLYPSARDPRTGLPLEKSYHALPDQGIYYADLDVYNPL